MARYVITGASGHIGNNLVRYINSVEPDAEIIAPARRAIVRELEGASYTEAVGNILDRDFLSSLISENDTVVHLAGVIDLTDKRAEETYAVNFGITKTVADICAEKHCRLIYASSVDCIPKSDNEDMISEPESVSPELIEGNYGKSKAMATAYVMKKISDDGLDAAVVFPSAVIGINDMKPSAVGSVVRDILLGKAEFGMRGGYNFVNVTDVCKAIYILCKCGRKGCYILSGYNVTVKEMYRGINAAAGISRRQIMIPDILVDICIPFVKVLNRITVKTLREPHCYSYEKARAELGFEPTPMDETFRQTVEWFKKDLGA